MISSESPLTDTSTHELPVYFIADSHLGVESLREETAKKDDLLALLEWLRGRASRVYLVGDIFDFWFEYPYPVRPRYEDVLSTLAGLSAAGTRVDFLGGNHDYWAGRRFAALTGACVHRSPIERIHFDRRIYVAHGDGLPRGDWGYRALKAVLRNPVAIGAFSLIPPRAGAALARWASGLSVITEDRVERAIPPMLEFMQAKLEEGFDAVVVGHVHRQMIRRWNSGTGVVVGDWMSARSVVELGSDGFRALAWSEGSLRPVPSSGAEPETA